MTDGNLWSRLIIVVASILLLLIECSSATDFSGFLGELHASRNLQSCTFDDLFAFQCSLDDFCWNLSAKQGITAECLGSIDKDWYILIQFQELCYASDYRDEVSLRESMKSDPPLPGFCSVEKAFLNFTRSSFQVSDNTETITYPVELATTTIRKVTSYTLCDPADADTVFGKSYCANACPQTFIGGRKCRAACHECPNHKVAIDCGNIAAVLKGDCRMKAPPLIAKVLAYLRAQTGQIDSYDEYPLTDPTFVDDAPKPDPQGRAKGATPADDAVTSIDDGTAEAMEDDATVESATSSQSAFAAHSLTCISLLCLFFVAGFQN